MMRAIAKLKRRYHKWREWCHYSAQNWFVKVLIFLGLKKSTWFNSFMTTYNGEIVEWLDDRKSD